MPRRAAWVRVIVRMRQMCKSSRNSAGQFRTTPHLARRQHHHHLAAFHARLGFHLGDGFDIGLDALQDLPAELLMSKLAAAETQRHLYFVALFEEPLYGP